MSPLASSKPATARDAKAVRDEIMQLVGEYYDLVHTPPPFEPSRSAAPVNGRVFDEAHAVISVFDHGFLYDSALGKYTTIDDPNVVVDPFADEVDWE